MALQNDHLWLLTSHTKKRQPDIMCFLRDIHSISYEAVMPKIKLKLSLIKPLEVNPSFQELTENMLNTTMKTKPAQFR